MSLKLIDGKSGEFHESTIIFDKDQVEKYAEEMFDLIDIMIELRQLVLKREEQP